MVENCFDKTNPEDLTNCSNSEIQSGVSETSIYYAPEEHIKTLTVPDLSGDFETTGEISAEIIMEEGKGFAVIKALVEENELTDSLTGNKGNKKHQTSFAYFLPDLTARNQGFKRKFKNVPLVMIVTLKNGRKFVVGSKLNPAYTEEANGTSGKGGDDNIGTAMTVSSASPLLEYVGNIPLLPKE